MFHFTIRDILWLTVVVAVGLAGLVAYNRAYSETHQLREIVDSQESTIVELSQSLELLRHRTPGP